MTAPDIADALALVVARATLDVDLLADLRIEHVDPFVV